MNDKRKDDIFYVCTLIEYISRQTYNHRKDIISYFDKSDLSRQLRLAEVNHCLFLSRLQKSLSNNIIFQMEILILYQSVNTQFRQ